MRATGEDFGHEKGEQGGAAAEEAMAISRVARSLRAAFPALPEACVQVCVARVHASYSDASVRTYIPILVAREAHAVLTAIDEGSSRAAGA